MKRRLLGAVSLALTAALTITGCGSSGGGGGTNGTTTLKLVAADYGTGPENTSQKYWQDIAVAFH
jgi:multiple sugar transport system substrate-binding protein